MATCEIVRHCKPAMPYLVLAADDCLYFNKAVCRILEGNDSSKLSFGSNKLERSYKNPRGEWYRQTVRKIPIRGPEAVSKYSRAQKIVPRFSICVGVPRTRGMSAHIWADTLVRPYNEAGQMMINRATV